MNLLQLRVALVELIPTVEARTEMLIPVLVRDIQEGNVKTFGSLTCIFVEAIVEDHHERADASRVEDHRCHVEVEPELLE